jgi:hypothetical protein
MVKHLTHNMKIEGSNTSAGIGREFFLDEN